MSWFVWNFPEFTTEVLCLRNPHTLGTFLGKVGQLVTLQIFVVELRARITDWLKVILLGCSRTVFNLSP